MTSFDSPPDEQPEVSPEILSEILPEISPAELPSELPSGLPSELSLPDESEESKESEKSTLESDAPKEESSPSETTAIIKTIGLKIAYDGTNFRGWQRQPNNIRTVQGTIESVVESLVFPEGTPISLRPEKSDWPVIEVPGSSRTDAGVHALGQVAMFRTARTIRPRSWAGAINSRLPSDIRIIESWQASDDFNPIGDTKRKRYRYCIFEGKNLHGDLFLRSHAWGVRGTMDLDLMRQAASKLIGTHDFYGFANSGGKRNDTVRTILDVSIDTAVCPYTGVKLVIIEVEGTGFLYNMVRIIAGTLAEIGTGKRSIDCIDQMIQNRNRSLGGITAPPAGLFLVQIWYE